MDEAKGRSVDADVKKERLHPSSKDMERLAAAIDPKLAPIAIVHLPFKRELPGAKLALASLGNPNLRDDNLFIAGIPSGSLLGSRPSGPLDPLVLGERALMAASEAERLTGLEFKASWFSYKSRLFVTLRAQATELVFVEPKTSGAVSLLVQAMEAPSTARLLAQMTPCAAMDDLAMFGAIHGGDNGRSSFDEDHEEKKAKLRASDLFFEVIPERLHSWGHAARLLCSAQPLAASLEALDLEISTGGPLAKPKARSGSL
jgi:hypothetical protein